jgi:predicted YcjX-like family ATPase
MSINLNDILHKLTTTFETGLQIKNGWGKNEVFELYRESLNKTLIDIIGGHVELEDKTFQWVFKSEVEATPDAVVKQSKNTIKKVDSNDITDKQKYAINKIETTLNELNIKFDGKTKFDAIEFISNYINKTVDDIKNFKPFD